MTEPQQSESSQAPVVRRVTQEIQTESPRLPVLHRMQRPSHRWRWALLTVGVLVATALGFALFRDRAESVEFGTVTRANVVVTIEAEGTTRIVHRHAIVAPVTGALARITVRAGDAVTSGSALASLTPTAAVLLDPRTQAQAQERVGATRAMLAQARAAVTRATLARTQSARDLERTQRLEAAGAVPRQQLEQAELIDAQRDADVRTAASAVQVAEHELLAARAAVSGGTRIGGATATNVTAPMSGVVLRVLQEDEGVVAAGTPLIELGDPSSLEVVTDVLSEDATRLRANAPTLIAVTRTDTVRAVIARIEPKAFTKRSSLGVDEQRVRVVMQIATPTDAMLRLGDGYRVDVILETARTSDSVTTVPTGALVRQGNGWSVYAVRDGKARLIPVGLGLRSATTAEIQNGLSPGDRVILFPSDQVKDGVRVVARTAPDAAR